MTENGTETKDLCGGKCSDSVLHRLRASGKVNVVVQLVPLEKKSDLPPGPERVAWLTSQFNQHARKVLELFHGQGIDVQVLPLANAVAACVEHNLMVALGEQTIVRRIELDERADILHDRRMK